MRSGRPVLTHGVQSGDVDLFSGTVWMRADRPSQMVVEFGTRPDLRDARSRPGAMLTSQSDFTGNTVLFGLPVGTDIYYRETAVDHG